MSAPFQPRTPVTCTVRIGGAVIPDGSDPALDDGPTVLTDLAVTWGRADTIDQPDASSCRFTIMDRTGGAFTDIARVGRPVTVAATGTTYSADTVEVMTAPAPSWDAAPLGSPGNRVQITRGSVKVATRDDAAGRWLLVGQAAAEGAQLTIPPATPVPATDPTGWDAIPKARPGQQWTIRVAAGWVTPTTPKPLWLWWAIYPTPWSKPALLSAAAWPDPTQPFTYRGYPADRYGKGPVWVGLAVTGGTGRRWADIPPTDTWAAVPPTRTWERLTGFAVDDTSLTAPAGETARSVLVWAGRITDATAQYDESIGAVTVDITASDFTADLSNRDVGAEPWPLETLAARAQRIITASGMPVTLIVDSKPGAVPVTRMDVDRQQVTPMLKTLAASVDAVLWSAVHETTGPYLWIEDMTARAAARQLEYVNGLVRIVNTPTAGAVVLDACTLLLDPVTWVQTISDTATRVACTWQDQSTSPDPTERTVTVIDAAMEAPGNVYGTRRVAVASLVTTDAAATTVATGLLARLSPDATWRISGVEWFLEYSTMDTAAVDKALTLLDGTSRIGRPVAITGLPEWSPIPGDVSTYVEGGDYHYTDGAWRLSLILSNAPALGASVKWNELDPAWRWQDFDPAIRWEDLHGTGP